LKNTFQKEIAEQFCQSEITMSFIRKGMFILTKINQTGSAIGLGMTCWKSCASY